MVDTAQASKDSRRVMSEPPRSPTMDSKKMWWARKHKEEMMVPVNQAGRGSEPSYLWHSHKETLL